MAPVPLWAFQEAINATLILQPTTNFLSFLLSNHMNEPKNFLHQTIHQSKPMKVMVFWLIQVLAMGLMQKLTAGIISLLTYKKWVSPRHIQRTNFAIGCFHANVIGVNQFLWFIAKNVAL